MGSRDSTTSGWRLRPLNLFAFARSGDDGPLLETTARASLLAARLACSMIDAMFQRWENLLFAHRCVFWPERIGHPAS
jgi:hypothetical protein